MGRPNLTNVCMICSRSRCTICLRAAILSVSLSWENGQFGDGSKPLSTFKPQTMHVVLTYFPIIFMEIQGHLNVVSKAFSLETKFDR